ncbi:hypothetical protein M011DRAFT_401027 [Sporormia fimetaria CBS 119925]|uniref:Cyclin-like domain-containing protein n=1 Tax=Sporormia fimetaria CBS 119925 TaxID=1340428 RepID=A0A6A6VDK7_9PLEO|nr:hypothetical protein M011DRAFT_401027 [Sporormia fimetaria CBS 119925]
MPAIVASAPRPRRERLETLKDPSTIRSSPRLPTPPATQKTAKDGTPKCCDYPDIHDRDNGGQECHNCGHEFNLESELRAEVTFGETSTGAAMVQGGFVGEDQRFANTMGGTMRGLPGMDTRELTRLKGAREIDGLAASLNLRPVVTDMAKSLYKLASINDFVRGRRIRNVAACCIYLADRKQRESSLLLMDLAQIIHVNVWRLGDTYKQFLHTIMDTDPGSALGMSKVPQLEPLVLKFCQRLEFGHDSYKVAEDACTIIKRMRKDWMIEGRQPAGIIGAAVILAARANNFRRTVREVVYCVKVADSTINQRLYEFKRTKSSKLTLAQFKEFGLRLKDDILPPAIYRREEKEARMLKRKAIAAGLEDVTGDADVVATSGKPARKVAQKRTTAPGAEQPTTPDGPNAFLIPDIPIDPNASPQDAMDFESEDHLAYVAAATAPEEAKQAPVVVAEEDLEIEEILENEVLEITHAWEDVFRQFDQNENHPILRAAGDTAQALVREHMPDNNVRTTEEVDEEEFADDPEVMNCVCSPAEVRIKEKVWVTQNEDWLREQQKKTLEKALEEAKGKPKKKTTKKRTGQLGDGSVLGGKPAASAADAVAKMMAKRAKFSSHIDYAKLQELFGTTGGASAAGSGTGSDASASPAASGAGAEEVQEETIVIEEGGEGGANVEGEEEEYDEQYDDNEPIDDLNAYRSDSDQGFEDIEDDF